jgi:ABC-type nitrate/sulfonate/bicarbonate transport system permease component
VSAADTTLPRRRITLRRGLKDVLAPALVVAALIGTWQIVVRAFDVKEYVLPAPSAIARTAFTSWDILLPNLRVTVEEMLLGFGLATAVGISLGTLIALSSVFRRGIFPLVIASQTVPVIAIAPVLVIWFGYDILPRVLVTALIAFFPLTVNTVAGLRAVDPELVRLFRSLNASRIQIFRKLTFPSGLPYIFAGLKVAATLSVIGATVGEWVGADRGLGYQIVTDTAQVETARVFAAIFLLSLSGIALYLIVAGIEWISLPWRHSVRARRRSNFGLSSQLGRRPAGASKMKTGPKGGITA